MELRERAKVLLLAAESVSDPDIADELRQMAKELLTAVKDIERFEALIAVPQSRSTTPIYLPAPAAPEPAH